MPLAFLVEQIGVACLADLWRIELQCDLPCRPFRLYPDAPLARLIGRQAKQGWEKGETSLGSPPILRLTAFASASPLANQMRKGRGPHLSTTTCLCQIAKFSIPATCRSSNIPYLSKRLLLPGQVRISSLQPHRHSLPTGANMTDSGLHDQLPDRFCGRR